MLKQTISCDFFVTHYGNKNDWYVFNFVLQYARHPIAICGFTTLSPFFELSALKTPA